MQHNKANQKVRTKNSWLCSYLTNFSQLFFAVYLRRYTPSENMVHHSKLVRYLAYFCGIIVVALGFVGIGSAVSYTVIYLDIVDSIFTDSIWLLALLYVVAVYFCHVNYLYFRFVKTIEGVLDYDSEGITFTCKGIKSNYTWDEIKNSKEHADCQIVSIITVNKKHVVSIWEYASGYLEFRKILQSRVGV